MNFKSLIVLVLAAIPCASFAESISKVDLGMGMVGCNYTDTQIISIKGGSDSSCKSTQLCSGTVTCFDNISKTNTPHIVSRTFPVVCTAKDGACPSVEDCRKPDNAVSFTKEARTGSVGTNRWAAILAETTPATLQQAYFYKTAYPREAAVFQDFDKAFYEILEKSKKEKKLNNDGATN